MRIMGIDYGEARTGLAFSDLTMSLAGEAFTINSRNIEKTADMAAEEAAKRQVSAVVLGYPRNMDGSAGERAQRAESFKAMLEERLPGVEIILWDERLTSVNAHAILSAGGKKTKDHKKTVDAVAASLILQAYLDSKR